MLGSQIILESIILFIIIKTIQSYKKGNITLLFALVWTVFWIIVSATILNPFVTTRVAHVVGIGRGVDLILYVSIIVIFYLVFKILVKQKEHEQMLTKIIRKLAQK